MIFVLTGFLLGLMPLLLVPVGYWLARRDVAKGRGSIGGENAGKMTRFHPVARLPVE